MHPCKSADHGRNKRMHTHAWMHAQHTGAPAQQLHGPMVEEYACIYAHMYTHEYACSWAKFSGSANSTIGQSIKSITEEAIKLVT